MLQRIQTVFLALAVLCLILMFSFPILNIIGEPEIIYGILGFESEADTSNLSGHNIWIIILVSLAIIGLVGAISTFKNRNLQMNLCRLVMFLLAGVVAALFFIINSIVKQINIEEVKLGYGIGYFLPLAALLLTALALNYIRKDDKLVKSVDRLR